MNETDALAEARALSDELGWDWKEPVSVGTETQNGKRIIRVVTNCHCRGGNTWFRFDPISGELLGKGVLPM